MEDQLRQLYDEWRSDYAERGLRFISDGLVWRDSSRWRGAPTRVLFLLKEPNDSRQVLKDANDDVAELWRHPERHTRHRRRVEKNLGRWAYAACLIRSGQAPSFSEATAQYFNALTSAAFINIKKSPGGAKSVDRVLRKRAEEDRKFICRQLHILNPELVVCCGEISYRIGCKFMQRLDATGVRDFEHGATTWLRFDHPAKQGVNDEDMFHNFTGAMEHLSGQ